MKGYFIGQFPERTKYFFDDLADDIRRDYPELIDKHISIQLDALGLTKEFDYGSTVSMLPYSFTDTN